MIKKRANRIARHVRIRARMKNEANIPRLSVFRSNKHIHAQIIDDKNGKTLVGFSSLKIKNNKSEKISKVGVAKMVGENLAKIAINKKITKVVFDRGGYKYHGRVMALAQGAREGGLIF